MRIFFYCHNNSLKLFFWGVLGRHIFFLSVFDLSGLYMPMPMLYGRTETTCSRLLFLFSSHVIGLQIRTGGAGMGRQPDRRRGKYCKEVSLVGTHGPLLSKNGEIISIIGRSSGVDRQIDTQPSLIRSCPGEPFYGNIFVDDLLCSCLHCRDIKLRVRLEPSFPVSYTKTRVHLNVARRPSGTPSRAPWGPRNPL